MNATLIGSQFGDEGKGRMTDVFGADADVVVRFQGGDNAGHTVTHDGEEYALRLVPSGVVRGKTGLLGPGCVVNVETLFGELDHLRERGVDPDVRVSDRAHVVFPYHRVLDSAEEAARDGDDDGTEVGTTGNGIGPAYEDKAGRRGVRVGDVLDAERLRSRLEYVVPRKRALAESVFGVDVAGDDADAFDADALFEKFREYGRRLAEENLVVDASSFLAERDEANVLFEGAQGTHLDVDHGNYPFVTSSNPTAGGAVVGAGVKPQAVADGEILGVVKAYLSRVGSGPMPTEFDGDGDGDDGPDAHIRERVGATGTVTGRPRRLGWLDLPVLRRAAQVNGFTGLTLSHLDALAGIEEVRVCTAYELDGERLLTPPSTAEQWRRCAPRYETLGGWDDCDWNAVADRGYEALPGGARAYVEYVSDELDAPVFAVGVGPGRESTIVRRNPFEGAPTPRP